MANEGFKDACLVRYILRLKRERGERGSLNWLTTLILLIINNSNQNSNEKLTY